MSFSLGIDENIFGGKAKIYGQLQETEATAKILINKRYFILRGLSRATKIFSKASSGQIKTCRIIRFKIKGRN